jgi:hypothetical protein
LFAGFSPKKKLSVQIEARFGGLLFCLRFDFSPVLWYYIGTIEEEEMAEENYNLRWRDVETKWGKCISMGGGGINDLTLLLEKDGKYICTQVPWSGQSLSAKFIRNAAEKGKTLAYNEAKKEFPNLKETEYQDFR